MLEIKDLEMALELHVYLASLFEEGWQYWPWTPRQVINKVEMIPALQAVAGFNMLSSEDPDNLHLNLWKRLLYKLEILAAKISIEAMQEGEDKYQIWHIYWRNSDSLYYTTSWKQKYLNTWR